METDRLSLLYVTAPGRVGGLERVVQALATGFHRRGHRVVVAAVVDPGAREHPFAAPLASAGVPVALLEVPPRAYGLERRLVRDLCREFRPDVMHTHGSRSDVLHVGGARRLGIPAVTTIHGSSRLGGMSTLHEWLQLFSLGRFAAVIAVSRPLEIGLGRLWVRQSRLHRIPNAWTGVVPTLERAAARRLLGLPEAARIVGWVGRLIYAKGPDIFLEAVARLTDPSVIAVVVGDGRERQALEARATALGLDGRVRFCGSVCEVARAFRAFDVFALTSRTEGTPLVLFEAMAAEVPIVATRVGGVPDVLSSEEGLLVETENPAGLARALSQSLEDPVAPQRAKSARRRLETEFALSIWLDRHEQLYSALARRRRGRCQASGCS